MTKKRPFGPIKRAPPSVRPCNQVSRNKIRSIVCQVARLRTTPKQSRNGNDSKRSASAPQVVVSRQRFAQSGSSGRDDDLHVPAGAGIAGEDANEERSRKKILSMKFVCDVFELHKTKIVKFIHATTSWNRLSMLYGSPVHNIDGRLRHTNRHTVHASIPLGHERVNDIRFMHYVSPAILPTKKTPDKNRSPRETHRSCQWSTYSDTKNE